MHSSRAQTGSRYCEALGLKCDRAARLTSAHPALDESEHSAAHAHHLPAVHHDRGTGDEAAGIGGQQQQRTVEIAHLAEAREWYVLENGGAALARQILAVEIGDDPTRRDGVHPDATGRKLKPERLGELNEAGLRYRVGCHALGDAKAQDRGNVDDRAPLVGHDQPACRLLRPEQGGVEVGAEDATPFGLGQLDGAIGMHHAGVVDKDVNNAKLGLGAVKRAHHRGAIEHVSRDGSGATARLLDARLDHGEPITTACDQRDRSARIRQHLGEAHPEPARGAGDQRDFFLETELLGGGHLRSRLDRRCDRYCSIIHHQVKSPKAKSPMTEKGYVDPAAIDAIIEAYETRIGPHNGARVVARAWVDAAFKEALLKDATVEISTLGIMGRVGDHLVAVENTERVHNMIVCTLCSCYPWEVLGLPPTWYKSAPYRSRTVIDPRGVLADFGVTLPSTTDIRVWDSTAETRFLVLPMRPAGTDNWSEDRLAALVTRDCMIGTGLPRRPDEVTT